MKTKIIIRPLLEMTKEGRPYGAIVNSKVIRTWFCSNDLFAKYDLGQRSKNIYDEMFPEGYELDFLGDIYEETN